MFEVLAGVLQNGRWAYFGKEKIGKRISEKNNRPNTHFAKLHLSIVKLK
jgi:hypothetical protein